MHAVSALNAPNPILRKKFHMQNHMLSSPSCPPLLFIAGNDNVTVRASNNIKAASFGESLHWHANTRICLLAIVHHATIAHAGAKF